ncbi:VOC family protein [Krasilnikovia sp. MM14-A1004]|uniref:VOC family protein n=1 Tax=Krasilnikovia sp. MM14-A1004 TaxID=3373541 RepID=UPI00399CC432
MANQNGRPIAPARKLLAAVLGTIAVFVMLFGIGLSSWSIVALGVALLALAIALAMVNVVRRGARAWVSGTAQVKAVSEPPSSSVYGRAELQVVVIAPGLPISEVVIRDPRVPVDKWPLPGDTLPVTVDVDDMRRVRISWEEAPSRSDATVLNSPPPSHDPLDEPSDDDLLGEPEPPPWAARDRAWLPGGDEPPPPPPPRSARQAEESAGAVIVREATRSPIILEGQLVDHDDNPVPAPTAPAEDQPAPAATAGPSGPAGPRPNGSRPSPRPRAATATLHPPTGTPEAPPAPAPEQRVSPEQVDDTTAPPDTEPTADPDAIAETLPSHNSQPEPGTAAVSETALTDDAEIDIPLDGAAEPLPTAGTAATPTDVATDSESPAAVPTEPRDTTAPAAPEPPAADPPQPPTGRPWTDLDGGYEPDERADELITAYPSARPGPAAAIHGVGITILVTDLDRSVAFYRDVLGFFQIDSGEGSAVLASGDTRLVLRTVHDLSATAGRLIHLNLEVGDVEAVYAELKRKGVTFVHAPRPVNRGDRLELWAASFHDPDDHNIAITQWRAIG